MLAFQKDYLDRLTLRLRNRIMEEARLDTLVGLPPGELKATIRNLIETMITEEKIIISYADKEKLINSIQDETVGFGPLEKLLRDIAITEIMVNGPEEVYIEKDGIIGLANTVFKNNEHIRHIIERIVAPIGRRIDESTPMVDGRLPDGSRVNAVIPPRKHKGPGNFYPQVQPRSLCHGRLNRFSHLIRSYGHPLTGGGQGPAKYYYFRGYRQW